MNGEPAFRPDQRAFLLHFTGWRSALSPTTTPVPFRKKARSSRAASCGIESSACFRLRHGAGHFAPAAFLRLSTCAPLSRSPNRRPKPYKNLFDPKQSLQHKIFFAAYGAGQMQRIQWICKHGSGCTHCGAPQQRAVPPLPG
jgi:hypothetical protein